MNKYLTAIIGVLTGVIGVLWGLFTVKSKQAKEAEKKVIEAESTLKVSEDISNIMNTPDKKDTFTPYKDGIIKKFSIIFALFIFSAGCAVYEPVCPALFAINKPDDFKDISYSYKEGTGYIFTQDSMTELNKQLNWAKNTIDKYEAQINKYNEWRLSK